VPRPSQHWSEGNLACRVWLWGIFSSRTAPRGPGATAQRQRATVAHTRVSRGQLQHRGPRCIVGNAEGSCGHSCANSVLSGPLKRPADIAASGFEQHRVSRPWLGATAMALRPEISEADDRRPPMLRRRPSPSGTGDSRPQLLRKPRLCWQSSLVALPREPAAPGPRRVRRKGDPSRSVTRLGDRRPFACLEPFLRWWSASGHLPSTFDIDVLEIFAGVGVVDAAARKPGAQPRRPVPAPTAPARTHPERPAPPLCLQRVHGRGGKAAHGHTPG
jgi:hypothetical protein